MNNELNKTTKSDIFQIDPRNIVVVNGFNSRVDFGDIDELAAQIKEQGVLNPISVQAFKDENGNEKYRLVDGERRYRAVMKLINDGVEIARIKALIVPKNLGEEELLIQQALRNEGKKFNEYEWGILAQKLKEKCGLTTIEIAKKLGKNPGVVTYWLQILDMDEETRNLVRDGKLGGSDLRRIITGNKHDEEGIKQDIESLKDLADKKGEKKLSLADLSITSNTIIYKDSKAIQKGISLLIKYVDAYKKADGVEKIDFNLREVNEKLKQGMLIDEVFNREKGQLMRKAE